MIRFPYSAWMGGPPPGDRLDLPVALIVIHHWAKPHAVPGVSLATEVHLLRSVERFHREERGWSGIGYNWIVMPSGHVYEGRGWTGRGAHTKGKNSRSVGIALAINGDVQDVTEATVEAVRELIAEGVQLGHVREPYAVRGHRDYGQTDCPGDLVYPQLQALRHDA